MKNEGYSIIELLIVVGFISILLGMGMTVSSKFAERRSIDDITYKISSSLSRTKLQAARSGVEYVTDLIMDEGILTINTYRGSSNRDSVFDRDLEPTNTLAIDIKDNFIVVAQDETDPIDKSIEFNPGGTLGRAGTINITPSIENPKITKCGRIIVSRLGRIRTAVGNWKNNNCKIIGDLKENETVMSQ